MLSQAREVKVWHNLLRGRELFGRFPKVAPRTGQPLGFGSQSLEIEGENQTEGNVRERAAAHPYQIYNGGFDSGAGHGRVQVSVIGTRRKFHAI